VKFAVAVPEVFVAVIVYVTELETVFGVPESNPVEELNESVPLLANDGEIENEAAVPPEFVIV
jgi:hypothetical protein